MMFQGRRKTDRMRIQLRFCGFSEAGARSGEWQSRPRKLIQGMNGWVARLAAPPDVRKNWYLGNHSKALAIMQLV
jgi:hypothetical protein